MTDRDPIWVFARLLCDYLYLDLVEIEIATLKAVEQAFPMVSSGQKWDFLDHLMRRDETTWSDLLSIISDQV